MSNFKENLKEVSKSIIAIGFRPNENQITIIGSGFAITENGKILSAAHLYRQLKPEHESKLMGMVFAEQNPNGLEGFKWLPLELLDKNDKNDVALFQIKNYESTLLKKLELGDSETIEVGEDVYFVGFPYAAQLINDGFGITRIVNKGILSNIKRDGVDQSHKKNFFIVDAISNPGNSGCPLIDLESNKVIGIMSISFRIKSRTVNNLDIREPMHICAAKPINLAKPLLEEFNMTSEQNQESQNIQD
jgi:serine protease Do